MTHVIFVDINRSGVSGLVAARARGYRISFIRSSAFAHYFGGERSQSAIDSLDRIVDIRDSSDPEQVTAAMARLQAEEPIDAVVCVAHWAVQATAVAARRLGLPFTDPHAIRRSCDKLACRRTLDEAGIPSARFAEVATVEDALSAAKSIGYPVIVKPATGYGSLLSGLLSTPEEVHRYFEAHCEAVGQMDDTMRREVGGRLILEQRLVGDLFSVEIGATRTNGYVLFMIDQRKRTDHNEIIELGSTVPPNLSAEAQREMLDYTTNVLTALGLDLGIFHVEVIWTEAGPRLVEVNPRLMGGNLPELFRTATDVDIFEYLLDIHLERPLDRTTFRLLRSATSRTIAPVKPARVPRDLPEDWLEEFRNRMKICAIHAQPGQDVGAVVDNFTTLGFFQVTGGSYHESVAAADQLISDIGRRLGIEMSR